MPDPAPQTATDAAIVQVFDSSEARPSGAPIARPYGLIGLAVSLVVIFVVTTILTVLVALAAFVAAGVILGWPEALDRVDDMREAAATNKASLQQLGVALSLVSYATLSATILAAARWRGGRGWRHIIGWLPWHPFRASRLVWTIIPVTIVYGFGADILVSKIYPESKDWISLPTGALWTSLFVLLAVVFAPVAEELLFRGWLHTSLREKVGVWASILVTSVLFALAHWEKTHLYALAVFPVGIALAYIRERTGSLAASMTCHACYNGAASVLLVLGF